MNLKHLFIFLPISLKPAFIILCSLLSVTGCKKDNNPTGRTSFY